MIKRNQVFCFSAVVYQQKAQLFGMERSLNHVDDKWKKIIQYDKKHELICHFIKLYLVPLPPYVTGYMSAIDLCLFEKKCKRIPMRPNTGSFFFCMFTTFDVYLFPNSKSNFLRESFHERKTF